MDPADALFHKDDVDTSADNHSSSIISNPVIINVLDLTLSWSISSSMPSNPLIIHIFSALQDSSPLFSCSFLLDWAYDNVHLYFKGPMYVLPSTYSSLLHLIHSSPTTGHMGIFCMKSILEHDF